MSLASSAPDKSWHMPSTSFGPDKSLSALSSHTQDSELPLAPCPYCKAIVRELTSTKENSQGHKLYGCVAMNKVGNSGIIRDLGLSNFSLFSILSLFKSFFIIELTDNLVFMLFFAARTPGSSACSSSGKGHMLFG